MQTNLMRRFEGRLRPIDVALFFMDYRGAVLYCKECGGITDGGKPYCSKHVMMMPYAKAVSDEVDAQNDGQTTEALVDDVLLYVRLHGASTFERIARMLNVSVKQVAISARRLIRRGCAHEVRSKRGKRVLVPA